jgi:hypothetical protein
MIEVWQFFTQSFADLDDKVGSPKCTKRPGMLRGMNEMLHRQIYARLDRDRHRAARYLSEQPRQEQTVIDFPSGNDNVRVAGLRNQTGKRLDQLGTNSAGAKGLAVSHSGRDPHQLRTRRRLTRQDKIDPVPGFHPPRCPIQRNADGAVVGQIRLNKQNPQGTLVGA